VAKVKIEEALAEVPLFQGTSKRKLKRLSGLMELVDFMEEHSIVRQGEEGDSFYVVIEGQATVLIDDRVVASKGPGDYFGEIALLDGGVRTATVRSNTPMKMLLLRRREFERALNEDPALARTMLANLAGMFRTLDAALRQAGGSVPS
jgi:CRP-like cAMP-binding protein